MSNVPQFPDGSEEPKKDSLTDKLGDDREQEAYVSPDGQEPVHKPKKERKVSLFTFVLTAVSLVLAAVMTTYTVSTAFYKAKLAEVQKQQAATGMLYSEKGFPFELFSKFIDAYSFEETDDETMMAAALKAYVAETGDKYAYYYTADEYADFKESNEGESEGIGIHIIYSEAMVNGESCLVIKIINVMKDSPAEKFGLKVNDLIYGVGIGENMQKVSDIGHDRALAMLKGEAGTEAAFTVLRPNGDVYDRVDCTIKRAKVTAESVYRRVHETDKTVGIIKILQFDLTTPENFKAAMEYLIAEGCTRFVFDVRYNPGGDLLSIKAVLSYFLNEGDVIIRTVYKDGYEEIHRAEPTNYSEDNEYYPCSVSAEDIGKYKRDGFEFAVLCNGSTASAAELFTATFKDYGLGAIVGSTTYGKGSMQSIMPLERYGYKGALKLTVAKYFSGLNGGMNDGYDGVGIEPDIFCELSAEAASKNIYDLSDSEDDQLKKALEALNK